ncbi:hypothetical protein GQ53DRAFT_126789 [Thozetella sp. PMI_491]|nr:hypothetical protein GQ53DRAFT_126789 [Thozetella sp. PMI_491]
MPPHIAPRKTALPRSGTPVLRAVRRPWQLGNPSIRDLFLTSVWQIALQPSYSPDDFRGERPDSPRGDGPAAMQPPPPLFLLGHEVSASAVLRTGMQPWRWSLRTPSLAEPGNCDRKCPDKYLQQRRNFDAAVAGY